MLVRSRTLLSQAPLGRDVAAPPARSVGALVPPLSNVYPPAHVFNPFWATDDLYYLSFNYKLHYKLPYQKIEWKPRLLATLWVHGLNPVDWAPRKWIGKGTPRSYMYWDGVRHLLNIELWSLYMYIFVFSMMICWTMLYTIILHPEQNFTAPSNGWHLLKPYYVESHTDGYDYRLEFTPYGHRGGGKWKAGRFRYVDYWAHDFRLQGEKPALNRVGPWASWKVNDPRNNPLARATHR